MNEDVNGIRMLRMMKMKGTDGARSPFSCGSSLFIPFSPPFLTINYKCGKTENGEGNGRKRKGMKI